MLLLDSTHRYAHVPAFHHYEYTARIDSLYQRVCDLLGESLLHLQTPRIKLVHSAGALAKRRSFRLPAVVCDARQVTFRQVGWNCRIP
jgi:hypothetical protein